MRIPPSLYSLMDDGIITEVIRPLLSGKEAQVYLVVSDGEEAVAKVYKQASQRSFKNRAVYTEGRGVRNSRDRRAMAKGSRHGKRKEEAAWRSAEVDMIYRLQEAGVRVPKPFCFLDGVLVMELVKDEYGDPAPRLGEVNMSPYDAEIIFDTLIGEVVKMLCAGVVHADLSDFNVLVDVNGPVVIDFPQAIEAAGNQAARKILMRDVENLNVFLKRHLETNRPLDHAAEMWDLYKRGTLKPDTKLTGLFQPNRKKADVEGVLESIRDAEEDETRKRLARE